jgi:hypothetical protein
MELVGGSRSIGRRTDYELKKPRCLASGPHWLMASNLEVFALVVLIDGWLPHASTLKH